MIRVAQVLHEDEIHQLLNPGDARLESALVRRALVRLGGGPGHLLDEWLRCLPELVADQAHHPLVELLLEHGVELEWLRLETKRDEAKPARACSQVPGHVDIPIHLHGLDLVRGPALRAGCKGVRDAAFLEEIELLRHAQHGKRNCRDDLGDWRPSVDLIHANVARLVDQLIGSVFREGKAFDVLLVCRSRRNRSISPLVDQNLDRRPIPHLDGMQGAVIVVAREKTGRVGREHFPEDQTNPFLQGMLAVRAVEKYIQAICLLGRLLALLGLDLPGQGRDLVHLRLDHHGQGRIGRCHPAQHGP